MPNKKINVSVVWDLTPYSFVDKCQYDREITFIVQVWRSRMEKNVIGSCGAADEMLLRRDFTFKCICSSGIAVATFPRSKTL